MRYLVPVTLTADVAANGTFTVTYPVGNPSSGQAATISGYSNRSNKGTFQGSVGHVLYLGGSKYIAPDDFSITPGTSTTITITNKTSSTWLAGSSGTLQLEIMGGDQVIDPVAGVSLPFTSELKTYLINLGTPSAAAATDVFPAAAVAGTSELLSATVRVGTANCGRALKVVSSAADTDQLVTIKGLDAFGESMSEVFDMNSTNSVSGKKAFYEVTSIKSSAAFSGNLSVGTIDVFGLPIYLNQAGLIIKEMLDGATATSGTLVAGVQTAGGATATDGDVRGTYAPNTAADGDNAYQLIVAVPNPTYHGIDQYTT